MTGRVLIWAAMLFIAIHLVPHKALAAGDFVEDQQGNSVESGDSTFDPFSDYSEFEEGSEEESDVNFFHNGRFFTLGVYAGYETFTDILGMLYKPNFGYGLFLSYFFDLRFAIQVSFINADHPLEIAGTSASTTFDYLGKVNLQHFKFDIKYYMNTQNVTKGLGTFNPYLIGGFSNYYRTTSINGLTGYVRDTCFGFQAGAGIEIPMMKNKMFFGAQALYNYISFPDRGAPISINGQTTNINPSGDALNFMGLLGVNF